MIHVTWTGRGFWVLVVTFGLALGANFATNAVTGSEAYWDAHKWPLSLALLLSGAVCWLLGRRFKSLPGRVLIDAQTGEQVIQAKSNTFFFIPMIWWGPILALAGLITLGVEFLG